MYMYIIYKQEYTYKQKIIKHPNKPYNENKQTQTSIRKDMHKREEKRAREREQRARREERCRSIASASESHAMGCQNGL